MSGTRLVVFDLDGTLVDSSGDLTTAVNRSFQNLEPGSPELSRDQVRCFVGNGAKVLLQRALAATAIGRSVEEVLPVFIEEYRGCLMDTSALYPGVIETLDALGERALAVLTNKPGDLGRPLLEGLGIAGRFFHILGAGDGPEKKPDPGGLLALIDEARATRETTVLVGDSATDVKTGRAAGVLSVGVSYGFDPEGLAEHPPDAVLQDLRELPEMLAARAG